MAFAALKPTRWAVDHRSVTSSPATTPKSVTPSIFNDPAFHALNGVDGLFLEHVDDGRAVGALGGALIGDRFVSGHSAPFGGVDLARERETPALIAALVDGVLARLASLGVTEVVVRCPPACHHASNDAVVFTLLNRGFVVADADLNFHIDLRGFASLDDYVGALRSPARRALRHAAQEPWSVVEAGDDVEPWDRGFALLQENRERKGWRLSIDRAYVERARRTFPALIRMLELRHDGRAVASALTYRVRPRVEVVVSWGDAGHELQRSPMNRLALEVVRRALAEDVALVDLGTSTVPDTDGPGRRVASDGLIQFKHSVGAASQVRLTLQRAVLR